MPSAAHAITDFQGRVKSKSSDAIPIQLSPASSRYQFIGVRPRSLAAEGQRGIVVAEKEHNARTSWQVADAASDEKHR
jgi:hypothetical protein